ncbi:MAG TPA: DUF2924 domain-containing protein [Phycisphaerales bacterium]|nr:DUF2924 domain-containing protein [Phycisphaerales bacterium]
MIDTTTENVKKQIAALERMSVDQLQRRYSDVFGEPARSGNRQWLLRRVAWRIQALAEGDLAARAIKRSRERARELARDADLRLRRRRITMGTWSRDGWRSSATSASRRPAPNLCGGSKATTTW